MKELRVLRGEIPASLLSKSSFQSGGGREEERALTFCDVCLKYLRSKKIPLKCMHPTLNVSTLNCRGRGIF
jgi:hypothetical protein